FDTLAQLYRHLVPAYLQDAAADAIADRSLFRKLVCGGRLELLHAQFQALRFRFGRKDYSAYNLSDLHHFAWMLDSLLACEIGNMDQAVNALLYLHERAELRKPGDLAFDHFSVRVTILDGVPGIPENLSQPETQTRCSGVHLQNHSL